MRLWATFQICRLDDALGTQYGRRDRDVDAFHLIIVAEAIPNRGVQSALGNTTIGQIIEGFLNSSSRWRGFSVGYNERFRPGLLRDCSIAKGNSKISR